MLFYSQHPPSFSKIRWINLYVTSTNYLELYNIDGYDNDDPIVCVMFVCIICINM